MSKYVKSTSDLTKDLVKRLGSKNKGRAKEIIEQQFSTKGGSGSLVLDTLGSLANKTKGGQKLTKGFKKFQGKAHDVDMKIADKLTSQKARDKGKGFFINQSQIRTPDSKGNPNQILEYATPSLLAPIDKAKDFAVPMAGSMAIGSAGAKMLESKNKEGEHMKRAHLIEALTEKLSSDNNVNVNAIQPKGFHPNDVSILAKRASEICKDYVVERRQFRDELNKVAEENKKLKLEVVAKTRSDRAVKLASTMFDKGMIKKADIETQIDRIMDMNDDSYNVLQETIQNVSKTASESKEDGIEDLTFLSTNSKIEEGKRSLFNTLLQEN